MDDFKPGDVVVLRSGGPHMTVARQALSDYQKVYQCDWFDKNGVGHNAYFLGTSLQLVISVGV